MSITSCSNVLDLYDNEREASYPLTEIITWNGRRVCVQDSGVGFMSCKDKDSKESKDPGGGSVTVKGGGNSDGNSYLGGEIKYKAPDGGPSVHAKGRVEKNGGGTRASGEVGITVDY